jgi:uncharacterized protein (DUF433 family)
MSDESQQEAIAMDRYPGIAFRGVGASRRAWVVGTGLDVWEIIVLLRHIGSEQALADEYNLQPDQIQLALAYSSEFDDPWLAGNDRANEFSRDLNRLDAPLE